MVKLAEHPSENLVAMELGLGVSVETDAPVADAPPAEPAAPTADDATADSAPAGEAAAGGLRRLAAQATCAAGLRLRGALSRRTHASPLPLGFRRRRLFEARVNPAYIYI